MRNKKFSIFNFQFSISQSGMTIVEIAIGIGLTVVLGGALVSMGILAIKTSGLARMKARALRYAEEGIEVARRTRDNVSPTSLEAFFDECEGTKCCVNNEGFLSSVDCTPPELLGENEIFQRTITVNREDDNKAKVTVELTWQSGKRSIKLETFLTAWSE